MSDTTRIAPISNHPAFKWGVGVWFALLLGVGLFVMPATVHQSLVERLGVDGILPDTAIRRALLSGVAALLGLLIGLVVAARVAAINEAVSDDEPETGGELWLDDRENGQPSGAAEDGPRRPFNPREDLEEEGIAAIGKHAVADKPLEEPMRQQADRVETEDAAFEEIESEEAVATPEGDRDGAGPETTSGSTQMREMLRIEPFEEAEMLPASPDQAVISKDATESRPDVPTSALGDMSLDALTERLESALQAFKAQPAISDDNDPVIAFLRRETDHDAQRHNPGADDPQTELRKALDKLNRVGKPK
ncbi:hypothetical protein [Qipengyuania qiaonensis]|uniref:Uncharacterized protein n=1 Tax=Qipengyuania qiaonensis TaxID=2867240 RepID=A0ABS7J822_9SPHN|nr:hypothetical protein [Qipengyuania qiaonensis]MBX7481798.1 hypothetical protein [Qipengyuania qiaonensis]